MISSSLIIVDIAGDARIGEAVPSSECFQFEVYMFLREKDFHVRHRLAREKHDLQGTVRVMFFLGELEL
jgi:hypothetical protein